MPEQLQELPEGVPVLNHPSIEATTLDFLLGLTPLAFGALWPHKAILQGSRGLVKGGVFQFSVQMPMNAGESWMHPPADQIA